MTEQLKSSNYGLEDMHIEIPARQELNLVHAFKELVVQYEK